MIKDKKRSRKKKTVIIEESVEEPIMDKNLDEPNIHKSLNRKKTKRELMIEEKI